MFDCPITAGNWPRWHPASRGVSGATDHSAAQGERITEENQTGGRSWRVVWTMRERAPPHRWVIEGAAAGGGRAVITYRLSVHDGGTHFERELVYRLPNLWLAVFEPAVHPAPHGCRVDRGAAPPQADH